MATQYSLKETYSNPEFEYLVEENKKRLQGSVANYAQIRFKRAMQMRMTFADSK